MSTHNCEPLLKICPVGSSANLAKGESMRAREWARGARERKLRARGRGWESKTARRRYSLLIPRDRPVAEDLNVRAGRLEQAAVNVPEHARAQRHLRNGARCGLEREELVRVRRVALREHEVRLGRPAAHAEARVAAALV